MACVGLFFSACQDDEVEPVESHQSECVESESVLEIPFNGRLSKSLVFSDTSSVFMKNTPFLSSAVRHRTIKIASLDGSVCQEWFLDYVRCKTIQDCYFMDDDPNGELYGGYYTWRHSMGDIVHTNYLDAIIYDKTKTHCVTGFHVPTLTDIERLNSLYNSAEMVINVLELDQSTYVIGPYNLEHHTALSNRIWIDYLNVNHPEVGTSIYWSPTGNSIGLPASNNPDERCRFRFVRNITFDDFD